MKQTMSHFKPILLSLMLMFTSGVALAQDADELVIRDGPCRIGYKSGTGYDVLFKNGVVVDK